MLLEEENWLNVKKYQLLTVCIILSLCIFISACQESQMLFLNPPKDTRSAFSVHQQKVLSLDVLFVVGSSQDGRSYINLLTGQVGHFLNVLLSHRKVIDFHIGLTVASSNQNIIDSIGGLYFLTNENYRKNEFHNHFQKILEGISPRNDVSFFDAISRVLIDNDNHGFYRDEAHLLIVFVGGNDRSQIDTNSLIQELLELKANQKDHITVLSIYPSSECSSSKLDVDRTEEIAETFDGAVVHLCDPRSEQLEKIAEQIYPRFAFIPLTKIPLLKTVTLCYGSDMISQNSWFYSPQNNRIVLAWREIDFLDAESSIDPQGGNLSIYTTEASCKENTSSPTSGPSPLDLTYISVNPSTIVKNALSLSPEK